MDPTGKAEALGVLFGIRKAIQQELVRDAEVFCHSPC